MRAEATQWLKWIVGFGVGKVQYIMKKFFPQALCSILPQFPFRAFHYNAHVHNRILLANGPVSPSWR